MKIINSAGYPLITYFTKKELSTLGGFNVGGTNASGQIAAIGNFGLIDTDTPKDAYTKTSYIDGTTQLELVFSDEFEEDGRSFYPGGELDETPPLNSLTICNKSPYF